MTLVADLERALGPDAVISEPAELRTYECDGLTGHRAVPLAVVLPRTTEEVQAAVRVCHDHGAPFVARGAGTGLSGGAVPVAEGIVIGLARMNRILEVDVPNRRVRVQPGVTNLDVTRAVAAHGLFYAPDPSSQQVCTIGGNVAENSGGAHCLKYGFTSNHVLELLVVLADGEAVRLDRDGPLDLAGVFVGSEGTLGIATEIVVRVAAAAAAGRDAAGRVPVDRRRRRGRVGHHRRGDRARGDRDDGPAHDPGGRGRCRTPAFRATRAPSCSSSSTGPPWRSS